MEGGGERKNERERKWRKKVFYRGLNRDERGAVISRAPNIFCAHLAPRVPPAKKISSFFLFFISASTSGSGHERTKRQSEQSSWLYLLAARIHRAKEVRVQGSMTTLANASLSLSLRALINLPFLYFSFLFSFFSSSFFYHIPFVEKINFPDNLAQFPDTRPRYREIVEWRKIGLRKKSRNGNENGINN